MKHSTLGIITASLFTSALHAAPPAPKEGYRWVLNTTYSDEFNGTQLDGTKWRDYFDGWKGRSPAKFVPNTVSVKDGNMQIKNAILNPADGEYTIAGGAVQSLTKNAHFGYYEARFKASRISMSTTFWMSNKKADVDSVTKKSDGQNCAKDRFSQELDIIESIGGEFNGGDHFRTRMNFNTHYRYIDCNGSPEKFFSAGNNAVEGSGQVADAELSSESWEDFHTYGVYWKDANEFDFYADNNFAGKVFANTDVVDEPFPRPMGINMVTETYNWATPHPTNAHLNDDAINTSYYDWIRAYKLIPVDQAPSDNSTLPNIYTESIEFSDSVNSILGDAPLNIKSLFKTNQDRDIVISIINSNDSTIHTVTKTIYAGFGNLAASISLPSNSPTGTYLIKIELRPKGGNSSSTLTSQAQTFSLTKPYAAVDHIIPGVIQAEDYDQGGQGVAYNDLTIENIGGTYRNDQVDVEVTGDDFGGYNIGWMQTDEWLKYTTTVEKSGEYNITFRVSSGNGLGQIHLESNDIDKTGVLNIPNTGDWHSYQNLIAPKVHLDSGENILRLYVDAAGLNLNQITFETVDDIVNSFDSNSFANSVNFDQNLNTIADVYNLRGQRLQSIKITNGKLPTNQLQTGINLIKVKSGNTNIIKRVYISH